MMLLIVNLLWILYSITEGFREGYYWYFKVNSRISNDYEIHPIFSFQRGLVLIFIGLILFSFVKWYSILCVISMMLTFSFFHNGMYYRTRNKLDDKIYKLKWKDQSTTSTSKMTNIMTYTNRTVFMIIGILLQLFVYFVN